MDKPLHPLARAVSHLLIYTTALTPLHPAFAAGINAANGNTQVVIKPGNVPVVNIATPNGAGISHNTYKDFNVGTPGAVLNNATQGGKAQLGVDIINGNPNLKGKSAELIINEVTGGSRSELQGKLEVFGNKANVMIANPNGITCDGCGFINAPGVTLTTGKPQFDKQGALEALEVKKGGVTIGGKGLDGSGADYVDILSRATELNGKINAKNLSLTQGANRISFKDGTVKPIAGEGAKPQLAVDTKALGGMYANKIRLVATEDGVGVNLKDLDSKQRDITLSVNGKIALNGTTHSKTDLNVSARELHVSPGTLVQADGNATLAATKLVNDGQVTTSGDMRIFSDHVRNAGDNAKLHANNSLWIQKDAQGNKANYVENRSATIKTNSGDLIIRTHKLDNVRQTLTFSDQTEPVDNEGMRLFGSVFNAHKNGDIKDRQDLYKEDMSKWEKWLTPCATVDECTYANRYFDHWIPDERIRTRVTSSSAPAIITSGKNSYINAGILWNDASQLKAKGDMILTGNNLSSISRAFGVKEHFNKFKPDSEAYQQYEKLGWPYPPLSYVNTGERVYSWSNDGIVDASIAAGGNLVADFKSQIDIKTPTPNENQLTDIKTIGRPEAIKAQNVLLHAANITNTDTLTAAGNITAIADERITLSQAALNAGGDVSLTAVGTIDAGQSRLKGQKVTLISRSGDIYSHSSAKPMFFGPDNQVAFANITANDLIVNAGNNVSLNDTELHVGWNITGFAGKSFSIINDERFLREPAFTSPVAHEAGQQHFNRAFAAPGKAEVRENISITAGENIDLPGTYLRAGLDMVLNAGKSVLLGIRPVSATYETYLPSSRTPDRRASVNGMRSLQISAGMDIAAPGGYLYSDGNLTAYAGRNLWLGSQGYSYLDAVNDNNKDERHLTSVVHAGKTLTLAANGALSANGASVNSGGNMTLTSGGDMRFEAVQNHTYREGGNEFTETRTQQGSELNAGGMMTVIAGGSLLFQATKLVVKGVGANWKPPVAVTDWGSRIAVADQQLQNAQQRINQAQQDKSRAEQAKNGKSDELNTLQRDINTLKQRQAENLRKIQEFSAKHGKLMEIHDWGLWQQSADLTAEGIGITHELLEKEARANGLPNEINVEQAAYNDAQQRLSQATSDRDGAQTRLTVARQEAQSKGADEAKQKAQVDAHNQAEALRAGNMDIAAKGGYLYAQAMEESSHYEKTEKKRKWWGKKTEVKQTRHDVTNKVTEFTAAGNITLMSRDDSTYEASKIEAGKNARLTSTHGQVNFRAVKNTSFEQTVTNSKGFFIKQANKGYEDNKWVLPSIHTGGALTVDAASGVSADVKVKNGQALQSAIDALGNTPGTTWVKDLNKRNDVQWNTVKDAYDSWDYKSQHLNPAVAAVIAIAAAAVTAGSSLTTLAASNVAGAVGGGAVTSGAVTAGMASLASQAAVALVENQGNLSKTLQALGSSESVKATATAMAVGGALNGFDSAMGWSKDAAGKPLNPNNVKLPQLSNGDWSKVAQRVAGQSVISSSLNTTINGGGFKDNLTNALLANIGSQVQAEGANLIGDNGDILNVPGRAVSHAVLAGISAEIGRGDGKGAAAGALAAELAGVVMQSTLFEPANLNEKERQLLRLQEALNGNEAKEQTARVIGALTGALTTHTPEGAYSGADSAQSVYRYNMTDHMFMQFALDNQKDILAADKGDKDAAKRVAARREGAAAVAVIGGGGMVLTAGGLTLLGAAPELLAAARLVITGCKTNPALCLNQAGIYAADIAAPDAAIGTGAIASGTTLVVGKTQDAVKKLAQQTVKTVDESLKSKVFNTQPVADLVKAQTAADARLSAQAAEKLQALQKTSTDQLVKVFDPKQNESKLNVFGKQFEQVLGEGGSNKYGTAKVFATGKLSDREIIDYAQSLAGAVPLEEKQTPLGLIYVAKNDGMTINLRKFSSSKDETKARWTIDIINNEQVSNLQGKSKKPIEIKFR